MYNILIIGATGVGKSTLLNRLHNQNIASVGYGVKPETSKLNEYPLTSNITIWDSPGLGEKIKKDKKYKENIKAILSQNNFIDLIVIVIDINNKSITTVSNLIKFIKKIDHTLSKKFIFILNKVDEAKNFRYWNDIEHKPSKEQQIYIKEAIADYTKRIQKITGIEIQLFLHCSAEKNYNIHTISNSLYSYILSKHLKGTYD